MAEFTIIIVFTDAPKPPEIVRMTLKSMWQHFIDSRKGLTPEQLHKLLEERRAKIEEKIAERECLTQDECDSFETNICEDLKRLLEDFEKGAVKSMEDKPTEKPDEVKNKLAEEQFIQWLSDLLIWLRQKVKEIIKNLKEAIQQGRDKVKFFDWCVDMVKKLFKYLWGLFQ